MEPTFYLSERLSTRRATADDRDALDTFLSGRLAEFDLGLDHHGTDKDIQELPGSYDGGYFGLIERDDQILGTYALYRMSAERAEVRKMYLDPSLRGQGLGGQMLKFIEEFARQAGYETLELETASAMVAARAMYEKYGFREIDADKKTERCDRRFIKNINT